MFSQGGSSNLFDMETEFKAQWFEGIINAVTNSYKLQQHYIQDFIDNLNISSAMLLMEPQSLRKKDRLEIRNCMKDIMYVKRKLRIAEQINNYDEVLERWEPLLDGSVTFLLEAIMILRPTVREHFLRSLNIPTEEPDNQSNEADTESFHE